jgi:hypothetical protein
MFKNINKKLYLAIFSLFILFQTPLNINAEAEGSTEITQTEVESNMNDLSNRLVLAAFGTQALTWFDVENDIDYTLEMTSNDETYYAKPFNKNNFNLFKSFLIISLVLGTFIFSIYLFWIAKEGIIKTQSSGSFLGEEWNVMFTFAKIGLVTVLLYPAFTPYNTAHMILFKVVGYSNMVAKEITTTIVENQPRSFHSIRYPSSGARKSVGEDMINFMVCVKQQKQFEELSSSKIALNFKYEAGSYKTISRYKECMLSLSFTTDENTTKLIKNNKDLKDKLNLMGDFKKVQEDIMTRIINDALTKADKISSNLMNIPATNDEANGKVPSIAFADYKDSTNDKSRYWESYCDEITTTQTREKWTINERREYAYLGSRCISHNIIKNLTYPNAPTNFAKYLKKDNYLKNNQIDLCSHDFQNEDSVKAKAIIQETNNTTSDEISAIVSSSNEEINIKEVNLAECLIAECSSLNSLQSNLYTCSNIIHLYNQINKNKVENGKIQSTGFLTLGAYMYSMFNNGQLNIDSKLLLNNLKSSYETVSFFPIQTIKQSNGININFSVSPVSRNTNQSDDVKAIGDNSIITTYKDVFSKRKNQDTALSSITNFGNGASNDFLGFVRFNTCLQSPLRIRNGFSCGSVPSEMHFMGKNLFAFAVQAKMLLHTYQAIYSTSTVISKHAKAAGIKKGKGTPGSKTFVGPMPKDVKGKSKTAAASKVTTPILAVLPFLGPMFQQLQSSFVSDLVSSIQEDPDEFGSLTTEKVENQRSDIETLSGNGIALLAMAGGDSIVGQFFSLMINFILLMGLIFGYMLPLIPLYLWFIVIIGWLMMFLETITILPIWIPTLATPNNSNSSRSEKEGFLLILKLFLKAPLLCLGILVAWILTNTIVSRISGYMNVDKMFSMEQGNSFISSLDTLVVALVYCVFLWYIINLTITLMETFYEFGTSWLSGKGSNSMFGKDVSSGFLRGGSDQSNAIKKLNPLSTGFKKRK